MIRAMTYNICNANGVNSAGELQGQDVSAVSRVIRSTGVDLVGLNEVDFHTDRGGRVKLFTFPSHAPEMKIDYILTSPEIQVDSVYTPRVLASDHLPLIATLTLPR